MNKIDDYSFGESVEIGGQEYKIDSFNIDVSAGGSKITIIFKDTNSFLSDNMNKVSEVKHAANQRLLTECEAKMLYSDYLRNNNSSLDDDDSIYDD